MTDLLAGETSPLLWSISAGREAFAPSFRFFFFTVFREAPRVKLDNGRWVDLAHAPRVNLREAKLFECALSRFLKDAR